MKTATARTDAGSRRPEFDAVRQADLTGAPRNFRAQRPEQIIDHRPYTSTHDLVKDGLLTEAQFETVSPAKLPSVNPESWAGLRASIIVGFGLYSPGVRD